MIFEYADPNDRRFVVSCDFPFGEWHELSGCYRGIGWQLQSHEIRQVAGEDGAPGYEATNLELTKPNGDAALVVFCACRTDGEPVQAERQDYFQRLLYQLATRRQSGAYRESFQAQVLVVREGGVTDRDRRIAKRLLAEGRRRFIDVAVSID